MFSTIADSVEIEENQTYTYLFNEDAQDKGLMWSFERYIDEDYLRQTHIKREDIQKNFKLQQGMRQPGGLHHWYWTQIAEVQSTAIQRLRPSSMS